MGDSDLDKIQPRPAPRRNFQQSGTEFQHPSRTSSGNRPNVHVTVNSGEVFSQEKDESSHYVQDSDSADSGSCVGFSN